MIKIKLSYLIFIHSHHDQQLFPGLHFRGKKYYVVCTYAVSYFLCKPYHFIISKHFPEIYVIQLIRDFSPDSRKAAICKCTLL